MTLSHANEKVRTLIVWEIAAVGSPAFVEMYVNPTSIATSDQKLLSTQKTKGGYVLQYWGEALTEITIQGKTGAGGVEALNVIRDIYRGEQIALQKILQSRGASSKRRQSLAQLAASVVMWYQGQGYRGFFKTFNSTESADQLGIFDYTLTFSVTDVLGGSRKNFLPWQRKPWSTVDQPSYEDGRGSTTGGAYGTGFKMGELSAPVINDVAGVLSDPEFTSTTGITINPGTSQGKTLQANLSENANPLTPSNLFANK